MCRRVRSRTATTTGSRTSAIQPRTCQAKARSSSPSRPIPTGPRRSSASAGPSTGSIGDEGTLTATVAPVNHTVTKAATTGWDLSGISCDDDDFTVSPAFADASYLVAAGGNRDLHVHESPADGCGEPAPPANSMGFERSHDGVRRPVSCAWSRRSPCRLTQNPPYGSITGVGGDLKFVAGRNTRAFPYTWTRDGVMPTAGDFVVEMRLKYDSLYEPRCWLPWPAVGRCDTDRQQQPAGPRRRALRRVRGLGRQRRPADEPDGHHRADRHPRGFDAPPGLRRRQVPRLPRRRARDRSDQLGPGRSTGCRLGNPIFTYWAAAAWSDFTLARVRVSQPGFIDGDIDGEHDGTQAWTPVRVPPWPPATPTPTGCPTTAIRTRDRPSRARSTSSSRPIPPGPRAVHLHGASTALSATNGPCARPSPPGTRRHRGRHGRLGPLGPRLRRRRFRRSTPRPLRRPTSWSPARRSPASSRIARWSRSRRSSSGTPRTRDGAPLRSCGA